MVENPVDKLRKRMTDAVTGDSDAELSPYPDDSREHDRDRDVAAGPKTIQEKQAIAERLIIDAKVKDVEDTREETSGAERHDLLAGKETNIPPSIVQERLACGKNPETAEPWTKEDRERYDRENERAVEEHARAVKESEDRMRKDQAEKPIQPVTHVPISQLTATQKKAMQEAQDRGDSPVVQARERDQNSPEEIGRRKAEAKQMNDQQRRDSGVDEDIEKAELERSNDDNGNDAEKDADEIQAELDEKRRPHPDNTLPGERPNRPERPDQGLPGSKPGVPPKPTQLPTQPAPKPTPKR
jgi:hypothetical protein